jgi:hypothetical protein
MAKLIVNPSSEMSDDTRNIMKLYVFSILDEFDRDVVNKKKLSFNPYIDRISMAMDGGTMIFVPVDIQKQIVYDWVTTKHLISIPPVPKSAEEIKKDMIITDDNFIDTSLQTILCIIIIFVILYALGSMRQILGKVEQWIT